MKSLFLYSYLSQNMFQKAKYFISNSKLIKTGFFDIKELEKGFSIYEVVKIVNDIPLFLEDHLERIHSSAKLKDKKVPFSDSEIKENIFKLIEKNQIHDGRLKFAVRFSESEDKLICFFLNPINPSSDDYKNGVKIISVQAERENPNAKVINYQLRTFINKIISENQVFEVLLFNKNGIISECSKSTIFFIKNKTIYTSLSKDVLPGITRSYIYKICKEQSLTIQERKIKQSELHTFDSAFITGTSIGVLPVNQIDTHSFTVENDIIKQLSDNYKSIVQEYLKKKTAQKP